MDKEEKVLDLEDVLVGEEVSSSRNVEKVVELEVNSSFIVGKVWVNSSNCGEVEVNSSNCGKVEVNSSFIVGEAGVLKSFIGGERGELGVVSSNVGEVEVNSSFIVEEAGVLKSFIGGKRGELDVVSSNVGQVEVNSSIIVGEAGVLESFIGGERGELKEEELVVVVEEEKREGKLVGGGELLEEESGVVKEEEEEFDEELEKREIVGGEGEKEAMAPGDVISLGAVLSIFISLLTSLEFSVFSSTDSSLSRGGRREEELLWREERVADVVLVKEREGLRGSWEREKLFWGGELVNLVVLGEGGSSWGDG